MLWKTALTLTLHLGRNRRLALPLRKWQAQLQPNRWYYHPTTNLLWEVALTLWTCHGSLAQRTRKKMFQILGTTETPPPLREIKKATVVRQGQKWCLMGYDECEAINTNMDWCQKLRSSEFTLQWGLTINQTGSQSALTNAFSGGLGYVVSDGSFKDERGSAAWIIEGPTSELCLMGQIHTPGHATDHSSFRSEVAGIIGVVYTLTFWPPETTKLVLRLACDGLSVINRLSNNHPIDPTEPHADLLQAARTLIDTSAYTLQHKFVCGHQDNGLPTVLPRDAWLNIEADQQAKKKLTSTHTGPIWYQVPGNPWSCYVGTERVVKQLHQSLRKTINGHDTIHYWEQRKKLTPASIRTVDWPAFGRAM